MKDYECAKCGCREMIPDVRIIDHGHGNQALELAVTVYRHPDAFVFKGAVSYRLHAEVCGACGFTEFYAANPRQLLEIAKKAQAEQA
ncbi:hypothetical protein NA78x_001130 [Anatilimnocola sp. NA78]|uniref:hypothetical protein n=1 Tax=Anatilimnocola sp. NA78 TaxID=3415683 RepID=UPI003CE5853D